MSPREAETSTWFIRIEVTPECGAQRARKLPASESAAQLTFAVASNSQPAQEIRWSEASVASCASFEGAKNPRVESHCRISASARSGGTRNGTTSCTCSGGFSTRSSATSAPQNAHRGACAFTS